MKHKFVKVTYKDFFQVPYAEEAEKLLNEEGWNVARYITFDNSNSAILHLTRPDEEDAQEQEFVPVIQTAIEVTIPKLKEGEDYVEEKDSILKLTQQGWLIKTLYSGKAQLIRNSEPPQEEVEE